MATASARTMRLAKSLARSANLFSSLHPLLYSNVVRLDMGFRHHFHSSITSQFKSYRSAIDEAAAKLKMEITSDTAELDNVERGVWRLETKLFLLKHDINKYLKKHEADLALFKQKQKDIAELMTRIRSIKEQILYKRVVGQDIADESVADAIQRSEVTPELPIRLNRIIDMLKQKNIDLNLVMGAVDFVGTLVADPNFGERHVKRFIHQMIHENEVVRGKYRGDFKAEDSVTVDA